MTASLYVVLIAIPAMAALLFPASKAAYFLAAVLINDVSSRNYRVIAAEFLASGLVQLHRHSAATG